MPFALTSRAIALGLIASTVLVLGGCATTTVSTKEIVVDSRQQLAENFTPAQLSPAMRALVERNQPHPDRFKNMQVRYRIESEEDGRKQEAKSVVEMVNLGKGYVQTRTELLRNDVPYRINLGLTYGGLYKLRTQTVFVGLSHAQPISETKELKRFDMALTNPVKGAKYTIDSTTGSVMQIMNFLPEVFSCEVGESQAATTIHPDLAGDALALHCTLIGMNDVVVFRHRFAWLTEYGVALQQEVADARTKHTFKVESISVAR